MAQYLRLLLFSLLSLCFSALSFANEQNKSEELVNDKTEAIEYVLRKKIVTLVELATTEPNKADALLQQLGAEESTFNFAEQYLILLAKAILRQNKQQHHNVISLLEQAKLLRKNIIAKQLSLPLFSNSYLILANSYVAIKDYNNAYQAQKSFVDEYNDFSDTSRDNTIQELTKKYEISHKIAVNKILDNQNKLKEIQISQVQRTQQEQLRQTLLIVSTIFVFILLFLRQLNVRKKLLLLTQTDSLTGLLNRATFFKKGNELTKIVNQQQTELSVLLFNIDHFKAINAQYDHVVGDLVLEKMAQLVLETMRSRDVFARIGGEEFAAILPNTDIDKAKAIAMRVMEKITQYDFSDLGINYRITLSIGVATSKGSNIVFDELLHLVDLAMHHAKAQGGNQMVSYDSLLQNK